MRGVTAAFSAFDSFDRVNKMASPLFFGSSVVVSCCGNVDMAGNLALRRLGMIGWVNPIDVSLFGFGNMNSARNSYDANLCEVRVLCVFLLREKMI